MKAIIMETLPYQSHSETSKEAAEKKTDAGADRKKILNMIRAKENFGLTNDQISERLGHDSSFYSPRLIELERAGDIVKLTFTRHTRKKRQANIYVCSEFRYGREIIPVKQETIDEPINKKDKLAIMRLLHETKINRTASLRMNSDAYHAIKRLAGV